MRSAHVCWLVTAAVGLTLSINAGPQARAAVIAEWDFRNFDPDTGIIKLSDRKPGTTTDSLLVGGSVHPTAKTGLGDQTVSQGYISIGAGNDQGVHTVTDSGGGLGRWRDYYTFGQLDEGSVFVVYRPHFSGVSTVRRSLIQVGNFNAGTQISLIIHSNGVLTMQTGFSSTTSAVSISDFNWDSDKWYVVAGAWQEGSPVQLYIRAIEDVTPGRGDFATAATNSAAGGSGPANDLLWIGGVNTFSNTHEQGGDGDFAFVRFTNQYLNTEAQFDAVYFTFVPEPASAVMLMGVALAIARRPRSKRGTRA